MTVRVTVTEAELRGVPFSRYRSVLGNLIGEPLEFDEIEIELGDKCDAVSVWAMPLPKGKAAELRGLAKEITRSTVRDGYFG